MAKPLATVEVQPRPKAATVYAYSVERSGPDWVLMENRLVGDRVTERKELARDIRRVCIRKAELALVVADE